MYNEYSSYSNEYGFGFGEKKEAKRVFSRCALAAFIYSLVATAVIYITQIVLVLVLGIEGSARVFGNTYFLWGMQVLAMYIIAYPVFLLLLKGVSPSKKSRSKMGLDEFVILFFISEAIMTIGSLLSNTLTSFLSSILGYDIANKTSDLIMDTPVWIVILVAVIIGPIFEELIFRKAFIDRMGVYGDRVAIVFSAVSFGIFHGNFSQVIYATGLGLILGYIYVKTGDVRYSIAMHITLNFLGTVPSLFIMEAAERLDNMDPNAALEAEAALQMMQDSLSVMGVAIVQYGLAITGVVLFVKLLRERRIRIPNSAEIRLPSQEVLPVTVANVGAILFLIYSALQFVLSILPI